MFNETVKPGLMTGKSPLDPLLLWPIGPEVFKKTFFKGKFRACSMYLYNMKTINLTDFESEMINTLKSDQLPTMTTIQFRAFCINSLL